MSKCCGSANTLLYACSGGSNAGQISNDAVKALDQLGLGRMHCLIGIGAKLETFVKAAKDSDKVVAIDGCSVGCAKKALENAGITPDVYVVVTELGIEKGHHFEHTRDEVAKVAGVVADGIKSCGPCDCNGQ